MNPPAVEEVTSVSGDGSTVKTTKRVGQAPVETQHPQKAYAQKKVLFRTYQIIWYLLGVVEVLLLFRVVLRLAGANSASGFASLIYGFSAPLIAPFRGLFPTPVVDGTFVFEWVTLIAMLVYFIVAFGLVQLFQLVKPTTPEEVESTVNSQ